MLDTLKAVLRPDVATPDGWRAAYDLDVPDSSNRYLVRLRTENTASDSNGWSATTEVDIRDLDPAKLFTEQDSDGIDYMTIPTRYFRSVVRETHSRREEPWKLASLRFPVAQGIELARLEAKLSTPPPKRTTKAPKPARPIQQSGSSGTFDVQTASVADLQRRIYGG